MIPSSGQKWRPIEGKVEFLIDHITDNTVFVSANEGRVHESIPYLRFCEYFEPCPDEAVAP